MADNFNLNTSALCDIINNEIYRWWESLDLLDFSYLYAIAAAIYMLWWGFSLVFFANKDMSKAFGDKVRELFLILLFGIFAQSIISLIDGVIYMTETQFHSINKETILKTSVENQKIINMLEAKGMTASSKNIALVKQEFITEKDAQKYQLSKQDIETIHEIVKESGLNSAAMGMDQAPDDFSVEKKSITVFSGFSIIFTWILNAVGVLIQNIMLVSMSFFRLVMKIATPFVVIFSFIPSMKNSIKIFIKGYLSLMAITIVLLIIELLSMLIMATVSRFGALEGTAGNVFNSYLCFVSFLTGVFYLLSPLIASFIFDINSQAAQLSTAMSAGIMAMQKTATTVASKGANIMKNFQK